MSMLAQEHVVLEQWQRPSSSQVMSRAAAQASRMLVVGSCMGSITSRWYISQALSMESPGSRLSMKDIAPSSSLWDGESAHSWVIPLVGVKLKRGKSSSIGPRKIGKGLAPSSIHVLMILQTLS